MKNYYELLEVNPKASSEIIEKAYKILIKQCHPDLYVGEERRYAEERTRELNEAYHVLSDNFLRNQYDAEIEREILSKQSTKQNINQLNNTNVKSKRNTTKKVEKEYEQNIQYNEQPKEIKQHRVGTFMGIVDVAKEVFKKRGNLPKEAKGLKREDWIAAGITIAIVLILGIILWFIPATNGFIRSLNPF